MVHAIHHRKPLALRSPPVVIILTLYDVGSCHRPERLTTLGIPVPSTARDSTSVFTKTSRPPPGHSHDVHYPTFQPRLTTTLVMQRHVQIAAETPAYDTRPRLAARAHPPQSGKAVSCLVNANGQRATSCASSSPITWPECPYHQAASTKPLLQRPQAAPPASWATLHRPPNQSRNGRHAGPRACFSALHADRIQSSPGPRPLLVAHAHASLRHRLEPCSPRVSTCTSCSRSHQGLASRVQRDYGLRSRGRKLRPRFMGRHLRPSVCASR
ncbi:hypothetical protein GY45DRAFT_601678 [Cubamyces sp. BRFM 1775]|nr:hypothetical protein GY45DRAFT_601678 [Cubamyces sp. BRFM 1775]